MIGVGEHQAGAQFFELRRGECLDGGLGADRGEDRGEQIAVRGMEDACPGAALLGLEWKENGVVLGHGEDSA